MCWLLRAPVNFVGHFSVIRDIFEQAKKWKHLDDFCLLASCFAFPPLWARLTTGAEEDFEELDECEYIANILRILRMLQILQILQIL